MDTILNPPLLIENAIEKFMGNKAIDNVTGFTGIVTSICQNLEGSVQCLVVPKATGEGMKHEKPESNWVNVVRLNLLKD